MQLTALTDRREQAGDAREDIPCLEYDPALWFAESPADVEVAKALCRGCPVLSGCLAGALERAEPWGVWGGELFVRGAIVAIKRPRGRPRKDVAAAA
jgi:WhiB family redox-sensing transcriptional regulator